MQAGRSRAGRPGASRWRNAHRPSTERLESRRVLATFVVTSTGDSGPGTLRQAILDANTTPGLDVINFNLTPSGGTTIAPQSVLPNIADPVTIDGTSQPGFSGTPIVELSGFNLPTPNTADGLVINAPGSTIRGLSIDEFGGAAIRIAAGGGALIANNALGFFSDGVPFGNGIGVAVASGGNTIGGTTLADANVIAANGVGVEVDSGTANLVVGNRIGTDASGLFAQANQTGVIIRSSGNTIGGTANGAGNIISGNSGAGIVLNAGANGTGNVVLGNLIGTDASGTLGLSNGSDGVQVNDRGNTIGGTATGDRNIISANGGAGISLAGSAGNLIAGNRVGTDAGGTLALGNQRAGILIQSSVGNTIGGSAGNVIKFNSGPGVEIDGASSADSILTNSIDENVGLGIDLGGDGPTLNDTGDLDSGPNNLQNFPVLTSSFPTANGAVVRGVIASAPNTTYTIQFFSEPVADPSGFGEGLDFLGQASVTTDSTGFARFSAPVQGLPQSDTVITATATDPLGNTSEFSEALSRTVRPVDISVTQTASPEPVPAGGVLTYQVTVANSGPGGATGVSLADILPTGSTFISASATQGSAVLQGNAVFAALGDIAPNGSAVVTIQVRAGTEGSLVNTATATSDNDELDPANNTSVHTTSIRSVADLGVSMSLAPPSGMPGDVVTFTSVVTNAGPSPARGTIANETFGAGLQVISAQASQGTATVTAGGVASSLGDLVVGGTATITVQALILDEGPLVGTTRVASSAFDPNPQNDTASVEVRREPLSFTVINTNDSGRGSLRQAILNANRVPGRNLIDFKIPGVGPFTIAPISPLPTVTDPAIIDAQTQPGFLGVPIVELSGANLSSSSSEANPADGLVVSAGNSVIRGLIINRFEGSGIVLEGSGGDGGGIVLTAAGGDVVEGNVLGTDVLGRAGIGNVQAGILIQNSPGNRVGGLTPGSGNVISDNLGVGVEVRGPGATGNTIVGNKIGTNAVGLASLGNGLIGVLINAAPGNTVGGSTPSARNLLSGNGSVGVRITGASASGNVVSGNFVGTDVTGTRAIGNGDDGVFIDDAPFNVIGGGTPPEGNLISGNGLVGVQIFGAGAFGNVVEANLIGASPPGSPPLGNGLDGVFINQAANNVVGGTTPGTGNAIAGSGSSGVQIFGPRSSGNVIVGNSIGAMAGVRGSGNGFGLFVNGAPLTGADLAQLRNANAVAGNTQAALFVVPVRNAPVVQGRQAIVAGGRLQAIVLTFSDNMNAASVTNVRNYSLHAKGGRRGGAFRIVSASYDDTLRTATLFISSPVITGRASVTLTASGRRGGLSDARGGLLDGNGDGRPGGSYVTRFVIDGSTGQTTSTTRERARRNHPDRSSRRANR